jgi:purine-nucleoside phosphorylase
LRNQIAEQAAKEAASYLAKRLGVENCEIGIILGTGWGDKLVLENQRSVPFEEVPGFSNLQALEGHARKFVAGTCAGKNVLVLSGRIHLNEAPADPQIHRMVRLQTEILMQLGISKLIVTCAAGSLPGSKIEVGNLVVIDGFVTLFAPDMPLFAGEFCSPEDVLSNRLKCVALVNYGSYPGNIFPGGYAMVRGPFFEGRKYDKVAIAKTGASIVGMSTLPEACIAALYQAEVLALAFVTNGSIETHSHETNLARAKEAAAGLGEYLRRVIEEI